MEWSSSVQEAIARCKATESPLLILIEPAATTAKTPQGLLSQLATTSLHKHLFNDPTVQRLLKTTNISPLRIVADPANHDYVSFTQFFRHGSPPEIQLVSCNGVVLWSRCGYVSPRMFADHVARLCEVDITGWFAERQRSAVLVLPPRPKPKPRQEPRPQAAPITPKTREQPKSVHKEQELQPEETAQSQPTVVNAPKTGMTLPTARKTKLHARLPNGQLVTSSYLPQTPFHSVRSWLSDSSTLPSGRLLIATAFPRRVFDNADDNKSLAELDLSPSANLVVSDLGVEAQSDAGGAGGAGVFAMGRNALAGVGGFVTGLVGSFFTTTAAGEQQRGEFEMGERRESDRERERRPDDDNLRYNGNSTQFGYDDNDR